jgi:hypothetical protein
MPELGVQLQILYFYSGCANNFALTRGVYPYTLVAPRRHRQNRGEGNTTYFLGEGWEKLGRAMHGIEGK